MVFTNTRENVKAYHFSTLTFLDLRQFFVVDQKENLSIARPLQHLTADILHPSNPSTLLSREWTWLILLKENN